MLDTTSSERDALLDDLLDAKHFVLQVDTDNADLTEIYDSLQFNLN